MEKTRFNVTVNGKKYEVEVESVTSGAPQPREHRVVEPSSVTATPVARSAPAPKASSAGLPNEFRAPLNGVVLEVLVSPGQSVRGKEALCSIEAMKMKTSVFSDREGVIDAVHIKAGDRIEASQLLFSFK